MVWWLHLVFCRYVKALNNESVASGIPMMRAMLLEFPNDPVCAADKAEQQFMVRSEETRIEEKRRELKRSKEKRREETRVEEKRREAKRRDEAGRA